jgi:hypothetical protein
MMSEHSSLGRAIIPNIVGVIQLPDLVEELHKECVG